MERCGWLPAVKRYDCPMTPPTPPQIPENQRNMGADIAALGGESGQTVNELCNRRLHSSEKTSAILLIQSHRLLLRHLLFRHIWFLNAAVGRLLVSLVSVRHTSVTNTLNFMDANLGKWHS